MFEMSSIIVQRVYVIYMPAAPQEPSPSTFRVDKACLNLWTSRVRTRVEPVFEFLSKFVQVVGESFACPQTILEEIHFVSCKPSGDAAALFNAIERRIAGILQAVVLI